MRSRWFESPFVIVLAFTIFALAPLTAPGYFIYGHDARHSVYFLQMFDMSLRDGAWYPRWATDMVFGYGYPLWLILAPIPFYAGEAFHLVGLDFVSAVKLVDGFAVLGSALTMYLFASRILGKNGGLVAALAYAYIPYHLVDLYVRSAQAELISYVFPPLVFWAFHRLHSSRSSRYIPVAAFAYAGMVLAHIQSAVLFTPLIGAYLLCLLASTWRESEFISALRFAFQAGVAVALALGIAAIFVVPVLAEQKYLTTEPLIGGFFNFRKHFVNASQLLSPFWGYGYAGENGTDQFSLQLGLIPVLLGFVAILGWRRMSGEIRWHLALFGLATVGLIVAILPFSSGIWELAASIVAYVQFPWRLLIITVFTLAFLTGASVQAISEEWRDLAPVLAIVLVVMVASFAYTEPQHTEAVFNYQTQMDFEVKDRELLGDTVWMTGDRPQDSPLVEQYAGNQPLQKAVALDDSATIQMLRHGGQSDEVQVNASGPTRVMFYTRFFPGWTARIDGQAAPLAPYGEQGLVLVTVPAGSHTLRVQYEGTVAQQAGGIISLASIGLALFWLVYSRR